MTYEVGFAKIQDLGMRLKKITIRNFKRFTQLTIQKIPESARLIMLAGPNGSGKSSFFDALYIFHRAYAQRGVSWEPDHHQKEIVKSGHFIGDEIRCMFHNEPKSL